MVNFKNILLFFSLGLSNVPAQEQLFPTPTTLWEAQVITDMTGDYGVLKGNGVKVTPDGAHVIVTSVGGTVSSFNAFTGGAEWTYDPPAPAGGIVRSHSQVVFTTPNAVGEPYMVYSVVENENSAEAVGRVIALDMDGNQLWISEPLEGVPNGSPLVSDDGNFVFLVHNSNFLTVGHFTVLSAENDGLEYYSGTNETSPFSPPGIYHSPVEGNYDLEQGRGNTNDMIMWAITPKPTDTTIGFGNTFGFQFPMSLDGNATEGYFLLGEDPRNFQSITAPTLANQGLSAYLSTSRSGFYTWIGSLDNGRGRFSRGAGAVVGFGRNDAFAGQPVYASPAISNGVASTPDQPFVFGGTATTEFIRLNYNFSEQIVVPTSALIKAEARVDPFDRVVYFVEETGVLHQVAFDTLQDQWIFNITGRVEGEMALNSNGYILYVADEFGAVTALQVSEIPITPAPTAAPTANVTESPTATPTVLTVTSPTVFTTSEPTVVVAATTPAPSSSVTGEDTADSGTSGPDAGDAGTSAPTSGTTSGSEAQFSSQTMIILSLVSMVLCLIF